MNVFKKLLKGLGFEKTESYAQVPWSKKASTFLLVAEKVVNNLALHVDTYETCEKALKECLVWLSDSNAVLPSDLAYYVDSDETSFGSLDEFRFQNDSVEKNSLIFVVMVIGYFAHQAYLIAGIPKQMSESVCEAGDDLVSELIKYAELLGYEGYTVEMLGGTTTAKITHW